MRRSPCWVCNTISGTPQEQWSQLYGTDAYGNLPQYKVLNHKGHSWHPCPYSTQCEPTRARMLLGLDVIASGTLPPRVDHTDNNGVVYYMKTALRGSIWGYECTFPGCTFSGSEGNKYFFA